ncbi:MAG: tRNA (5-methylaminomethyl-2-thiouridine)(34)-methyltransferase MnmD [Bacteroidales bacterium]|nr:tRNA (5-methylaminomethyl-2-thiouridine)(34)-methyltransferase MnmD [Bacteroidales bacterium]
MKTYLVKTEDGSNTLLVPELKEHYHSIHGAVQESRHVFIKNGLLKLNIKNPRIFEMGFGTGLNTVLTYLECSKFKSVVYHALELYPLEWGKVEVLNYEEFLKLNKVQKKIFKRFHTCPWNKLVNISDGFSFIKYQNSLLYHVFEEKYNLVYFDAFAPNVQPELWDDHIFELIYKNIEINGIMVTYCAKGEVRRCIEKAGFKVNRLPGPPGKREMLQVVKIPG